MQFVHPTVLWALTLLAIPIAIHLFNLRRYKTIYFSDTSFLREVQQATKKQRKLKEWLVLFTRLLALAALVLAFAKPFIPVNSSQQQAEKIAIVIDNSASSTAGLGEMQPIERGKQIAQQLVKEFSTGTEVSILTAESEILSTGSSQKSLSDFLQSVEPTDLSLDLDAITKRIEPRSTVYFISDLQSNSFNVSSFQRDSLNWVILPITTGEEANLSNIAVDSVWAETPFLLAGQPVDFFVQLYNYSTSKSEVNIEVLTNNLPEISLNIALQANKDTVIKVLLTQLSSGYNTVQINLPGNPVGFDNSHYRSYFIPLANQVVEIYQNEPSKLLSRIFSGDEFTYTTMSAGSIDNTVLNDADLILLNELPSLSPGLEEVIFKSAIYANVFMIPNSQNPQVLNGLCKRLGTRSYGSLDTATVGTKGVNKNDPFFDDVFAGSLENTYWPTARKHFKLSGRSLLPQFTLLELNNDDALFNRYANNQTNVFQLSTPLNDAFIDLASHPVVIPMFIKALMRRNNINGYTGSLGHNQRFEVELPESFGEMPVSIEKNALNFIPQQRNSGNKSSIIVGKELAYSGFYNLTLADNSIATIAFNTPNYESDLKRFTEQELALFITNNALKNVEVLRADAVDMKTVISEWRQGIQLWKYALFIALILILVEVILLRFLK